MTDKLLEVKNMELNATRPVVFEPLVIRNLRLLGFGSALSLVKGVPNQKGFVTDSLGSQ